MAEKEYHGFSIGDRVKVKKTQPAYFKQQVQLSDVGTIGDFPEKLQKETGDVKDDLGCFAFVEFDRTFCSGKKNVTAAVDICNLIKA